MIKRKHQTNNSSSVERWTTTFSQSKQIEKRKRLATLTPTFNTSEVVEEETSLQSVSTSRTKQRLPVPCPSDKEANPSVEIASSFSPQEVIHVQPRRRPKVRPKHSPLQSLALLVSFAMVTGGFIGIFAAHAPKSQTSPKETVAQTTDSFYSKRPVPSTTDHLVADTSGPQAAGPIVTLPLPVEPLVEQVHQEQEVDQVHQEQKIQLAQDVYQAPDVHQQQEVQLADKNEPQSTDLSKADALVARVIALMEQPTENVDIETTQDTPSPDIPPAAARLAIEPPTVVPVDRPVLKKPLKIARIQKFDADQLRAMLKTETASVDLLQSKREFAAAKRFIRERETVDMLMGKQMQLRDQASQPGADQLTLQRNLSKLQREVAAKLNKPQQRNDPNELLSNHLSERKDLQALPLAMDDQCRVGVEEAFAMNLVSGKLGRLISEASGGERGAILRNSGNTALRSKMIKDRQDKAYDELRALVNPDSHPQYLKTTDQILQAQHRQDRLELINTLKETNNSTAINLLAKRAKYDLSASVRMAATNALAEFPRDQYRADLIAGLKYPWHVVAQHSAEALVRLDDKEAISELIEMLDLPHPAAPIEIEQDEYVQPTLVAINHMRNCLLCHAPSLSLKDQVKATVPNWDSPIPTQYYAFLDTEFVAVRADITYLKQDFSVVQRVVDHGPWPSKQRFDYVVQQTPLKRSKADRVKRKLAKAKNLNREAIIFALRKLTNETPENNSSESWKAILKQQSALLAQADNR